MRRDGGVSCVEDATYTLRATYVLSAPSKIGKIVRELPKRVGCGR